MNADQVTLELSQVVRREGATATQVRTAARSLLGPVEYPLIVEHGTFGPAMRIFAGNATIWVRVPRTWLDQ